VTIWQGATHNRQLLVRLLYGKTSSNPHAQNSKSALPLSMVIAIAVHIAHSSYRVEVIKEGEEEKTGVCSATWSYFA